MKAAVKRLKRQRLVAGVRGILFDEHRRAPSVPAVVHLQIFGSSGFSCVWFWRNDERNYLRYRRLTGVHLPSVQGGVESGVEATEPYSSGRR